MKVYRYLSEEELKNILSNEKENLGKTFSREELNQINNFKYKKGVKYLHFFKHKKDIKNIQVLKENDKGAYYICEFDIPLLKLLFNVGYGVYTGHGYDEYYKKTMEFIIDVDTFDSSWLKKVEKDEKKQELIDK